MKKSSFVAMIMGTVGGLLLAIGMCMCLISEWNAFTPGVIMGAIGLVVLLATVIVWRRMAGKEPVHLNRKTVGTVIFGIVGALLLGVGMCLAMVWDSIFFGIAVGVVGIIALLSLVPMAKGLR